MITARTTRLLRAPDLQSFRQTLASIARVGSPLEIRDRLVLVPTQAAAGQLVRTIERGLAESGATLLPDLITANELTERLAARLPDAPSLLSAPEREVLLTRACRNAIEDGNEPPFRLRPGLVAEVLRFYDTLRRRERDVATFERLMVHALEPSAADDRGAARLLRQTRFLASAFRHFDRLCEQSGVIDIHGLKDRVVSQPAARPWRHVVVAVGDRAWDPHGLWPADWDTLTRTPGIEQLDLLVTDTILAGAFHERVHQLLPGIEEVRLEAMGGCPSLLVPDGDTQIHRVRDREEEIVWFVRWIRRLVRTGRLDALDRAALVVRHPLPYVYLTREVLRAGGVPGQMADALPLAAEPYAAALDLVLSFVAADFSRTSSVALLRSPHFRFDLRTDEVAALDRALVDSGYLGGLDALAALVPQWEAASGGRTSSGARRAGRVLYELAEQLGGLARPAPGAAQLTILLTFLTRHGRMPEGGDDTRPRQLRARAAVLGILESLRDAYARWDDAPIPSEDLAGTIRRWIAGHTFAPRTGLSGVHLVDASSARFGDFDVVQLAGLVEGEWPGAPERGIFYSASLLRELGWPADADRLAGERLLFADLLSLPSRQLALTAFTLEDEAVVAPSPLVDEVPAVGLVHETEVPNDARVFDFEALAFEPVHVAPLLGAARSSAERRLAFRARTDRPPAGTASPVNADGRSVGALERYQDCPFKFFAADVLALEETPEDEPWLSPRARGRFIHEVFEQFFAAWADRRGGRITSADLDEARAIFAEVAEPLLGDLPEADASLERARLFGSAIAVGMVDVVLGIEASRPHAVLDRWLEHRFDGPFTLGAGDRPSIVLKGVADRIDLLEGHRLRVIDYKSGSASNARRALQVPIYALCAVETLAARDGHPWTVDEAAYVAFSARRPFVPVIRAGGQDAADVLNEARARLFAVTDGIAAGAFPPRPYDPIICGYCAYPSVCRKDYVGDD